MLWLPVSSEVALSLGHTVLGSLRTLLLFRTERVEKRQAVESQRRTWSRTLSALLVSSAVIAPFTLGLLLYWVALSAP